MLQGCGVFTPDNASAAKMVVRPPVDRIDTAGSWASLVSGVVVRRRLCRYHGHESSCFWFWDGSCEETLYSCFYKSDTRYAARPQFAWFRRHVSVHPTEHQGQHLLVACRALDQAQSQYELLQLANKQGTRKAAPVSSGRRGHGRRAELPSGRPAAQQLHKRMGSHYFSNSGILIPSEQGT